MLAFAQGLFFGNSAKNTSDFIEIKKMFCSPFKKENNPSCSIFRNGSRLFYKDFSSGNGGDCFNLIQVKYNCNYQESLNVHDL